MSAEPKDSSVIMCTSAHTHGCVSHRKEAHRRVTDDAGLTSVPWIG
jgi:hypothetical protein